MEENAAIFSSHLARTPLKVVDCFFARRGKKRVATIDDSGLTVRDVKGKAVLVVESTRQAGSVFQKISRKLRSLGALDIRSFALVLLTTCPSRPDYWGYELNSVPVPPWALGTPHDQLVHDPTGARRQ